jgi:hypothetical protein
MELSVSEINWKKKRNKEKLRKEGRKKEAEEVVEVVTLLSCIWEVPGSNLGLYTDDLT